MRLLLDQGLPRSTVFQLRKERIEALHVREIGLASASDAKILDFAFQELRILVTRGSIRSQRAVRRSYSNRRFACRGFCTSAAHVLTTCKDDLEKGSMVTVTEVGIRVRQLPLLR
jgi:hypothetical protein